MIKGLGYLKYLKQSLIGFGISFFILLGGSYVNGLGVYSPVGINGFSSPLNSSYTITPLKGGGLLTNYLGVGKSVLALDNQRIFWWTKNGYPYAYLAGGHGTVEGFFDRYYNCDMLSGSSELSGCTYTLIDYSGGTTDFDKEVFQSFFNSVKAGDTFYVSSEDYRYVGSTWSYSYNFIRVCWDSEELGRSFCFQGGQCGGGHAICNTIGSLVNSQNLQSQFQNGLTFGLLSTSRIGYAPGQAGYDGGGNIDGGSYEGEFNVTTGNTVSLECSKNRALEWYRCNGYKSRMCYSSFGNNSEILQSGQSAVGFAFTGTDILDVWFDTWDYRRNGLTGESMGYEQWFNYWRNTYDVYKRNPQHTNPFYGVPVSIFTLMGNVDVYGKPYTNQSVLEFCDLALYTSNLNSEYTGVAYQSVCNMSAIDIVDCRTYNTLHPEDGMPVDQSQGTVGPVGSSWDGITNRPGFHATSGQVGTGDLNLISDGKTFTNNFFSLLAESYKYPDNTSSEPILPTFIIISMCGLILFRFLSH